jgi:RHS repeat-associated protein
VAVVVVGLVLTFGPGMRTASAAAISGTVAGSTSQAAVTDAANVGQLSILAGTGQAGLPTVGPATSSDLYYPAGAAVDTSGNVYIADRYNYTVDKVDPSGNLTIVAGVPGETGAPTPGPAVLSELGPLVSVGVDGQGDVLIADPQNDVVEEVTPAGVLSIVAGIVGQQGTPAPGPAIDSDLYAPNGVAADASGDIYISDTFNYDVVKVTPDGTLSIVAGIPGQSGNPTPGPATASELTAPAGVAVDGAGNLYIADYFSSVVAKVTPGGTLSIVAGAPGQTGRPTPGPATGSDLANPWGVAVDGAGDLFIADESNQVVEEVDTSGTLSVVAGIPGESGAPTPGPATSSELNAPTGVAVDAAGNLIIADQVANYVLEVAGVGASASSGTPVLSESQQGGGGNATVNGTTACAGDPVNCASGELFESYDDLSVPGRGLPLDFTRSYTSGFASTDGQLGYGWTDSYAMSLSTDSSGNVTVHQEDGSTVTFSPNGSGGYTAPSWVLGTLSQRSGGTHTFTRDQTQDRYVFSQSGELLSESDRNGYTTTLTYNSGGELTAVTDPEGRSLSFAYTSAGQIASVTDPAGRTESFTYDAAGDLVSATDPAGGTWTFTYNPDHLMLTMTDPNGGTTTNTYNSSGQVVEQVDPMGRVTTWAYSGDNASAAGGTTTMTSPNGNVTVFDYQNLELQSEKAGAGTAQAATTSYTYDPVTLGVASVTDADGGTTTSTYDAQGSLLTQTDPLGRTTTYAYSSFNEPTSVIDPSGGTSTYSYDANGNLLSISRPLTSTGQVAKVTLTYGDSAHPGDVTAISDADGNTWKMAYDADGDQVSVTDRDGDTTTSSYSSIGELLSQVSPDGNVAGASPSAYTTTYAYNPLEELTSTTNPLGAASTTAYDADGNVVKTVDADGNATTYSYDLDNELTATTEPNGTVEKTGYDQDGNVVSQTDGAGDVTTYAYNALDRGVSTTDPLGHSTTYSYDPEGNLITEGDPSGQTTTNGYDADNELTSIHYSDSTPSVSYSYDSLGQRTQMVDGTGTTAYSYDSLGRLTQVTDGAGSTVGYGYNLAGNLTSLIYPNGKAVTQAYNAAGQLSSVTDWLGNAISFSYDADGNLVAEADPSGVKQISSYNAASQLTGITDTLGSTSLANFSYGRDPLGQQTSATTTGAVSGSEKYSYTSLNQLASANGQAYAYNAASDLIKTPTATLTYNAGDELTQVTAGSGTTSLSYDANGDRTSETGPGTAAQSCDVCVLDPSASGALTLSGAATVKAAGIVTVDSSSSSAVELSGSATVAGTEVLVAGGVTKSGTAGSSPAAVTGAAIAPDPLAALPAPALTGSATALTVSGSKSQTASPGIYSTITVSGAGSLTLNPGTYVVTGGVTVSGSGSMTGSGVTLYLACSSYPTPCAAGTDGAALSVTGNGVVHLTGGAVGSGKGVAIFADRANAATLTVSGSGALTLTGSLYAASGSLTLTGSSPLKVTDGVVDVDRAQLTGSAGLSVANDSSAVSADTYTYDAAQRLIGLQSPTATATYAYDGDGLRMSETVDGVTSQFTWNQSGSLPLLLSDGTNDYLYGPGGMPIEQITGATAVDLHQDGQGSTRLLTSSTGAVVGTYSYDPYGNVTSHTGASTPLEYGGQYTDAATGLQYLQARYYDPSTGQFLTVDPLVAMTATPYGYASDNPLNRMDRSGLDSGCGGETTSAATESTLANYSMLAPVSIGSIYDYIMASLNSDIGQFAGGLKVIADAGSLYYGVMAGLLAGEEGTAASTLAVITAGSVLLGLVGTISGILAVENSHTAVGQDLGWAAIALGVASVASGLLGIAFGGPGFMIASVFLGVASIITGTIATVYG